MLSIKEKFFRHGSLGATQIVTDLDLYKSVHNPDRLKAPRSGELDEPLCDWL